MSLAPIDFGLGGWKQEIPGTFNPRTGKVEYPKPEVLWDRGRMASEIFSGLDPEDFESAFSVAQTPRGDSVPIYFDKHMKQYAPRPFGPQQFPEYMQAGGPSLFPIKKDLPGEVKGTIRGVQDGSRNDLSKPYGGLRKAGMLFANEGLFSA